MTTDALPTQFVARMRAFLGSEADAFISSYDDPATAGLRVNTLKCAASEFESLARWSLQPVAWLPSGFRIDADLRPGRHPFHAAGLFYLQEPSGMAVAEALDVRPGQLVLDLAASPGGKATHIASLLEGKGILAANEMIGSRIKPLGENLERWGAPNTILLNDEPERIATQLGPIFDRVLLDAPCSGEGMFRKSPVAIREWSPEHVAGSAVRQAKILPHAAALVRAGGLLLYSTCTFAPEENEQQIAQFLDGHEEWELVDIPKRNGIAPGRPEWATGDHPLQRSARLWPHLIEGEGHFLALMRKQAPTNESEPVARSTTRSTPPSATIESWLNFAQASLEVDQIDAGFIDPSRLVEQSGTLFLAPENTPSLDGLHVVRPGLPLGSAKPGRFEPSHALALALRTDQARNAEDLALNDIERYLEGHQLEMTGPAGWVLITFKGFPIGWGRRSNNVMKNHFPKGLRR